MVDKHGGVIAIYIGIGLIKWIYLSAISSLNVGKFTILWLVDFALLSNVDNCAYSSSKTGATSKFSVHNHLGMSRFDFEAVILRLITLIDELDSSLR